MPEPITALYLQPSSLFGGAERQAATNVPLLPGYGVEVIPLVGPGRVITEWLAERGVTSVVHAPHFPGGWRKPRGLERLLLPSRYLACYARSVAQIDRILSERRVDAVLAAMPFSWIVATRAAHRHGIPVVWRCGGTEIRPWEKLALAAFARTTPPDLLVCCSTAVDKTIAPLIPAPSKVILNGIDTEQFSPTLGDARRYRPRGARVVIGFAARMVAQKRPHDFLAMAARIAARHRDVSFLFAGEGSLREPLEAKARAMGLGGQISILTYVADMQSFYAACDIFVLPSRSEGCPNVVLEALASRKAVVVSDAAGTREVIREGVDGLVYPIGDVGALTRAVEQLIVHDRLRADLAASGHERVASGFSAKACARDFAETLRQLADDARGSKPRSAPPGTRPARRAAATQTPRPASASDTLPPDTPLAARRGTG
jgi:glycosyltransferase involved in cell wall biosynthesis